MEALYGLWDFFKLSIASGDLAPMSGYMKNASIAVDALFYLCEHKWMEFMFPLGYFAGTGNVHFSYIYIHKFY
ncbi:hypothetical protein DsansV1_C06g0066101 [Dioscorea sansibarensis]